MKKGSKTENGRVGAFKDVPMHKLGNDGKRIMQAVM